MQGYWVDMQDKINWYISGIIIDLKAFLFVDTQEPAQHFYENPSSVF